MTRLQNTNEFTICNSAIFFKVRGFPPLPCGQVWLLRRPFILKQTTIINDFYYHIVVLLIRTNVRKNIKLEEVV